MNELTQTELNSIIAAHKDWLSDSATGTRANFVNKQITNLDFHDDTDNEDGSGYIDLSQSLWKRCSIIHSNLDKVKFNECNFNTVNFSACSMEEVQLNEGSYRNVNFDYCDLKNGESQLSSLHNNRAYKANFTGFVFSGVTIGYFDFSSANLTGMTFQDNTTDNEPCKILGWNLVNAQLNGISIGANTQYNIL